MCILFWCGLVLISLLFGVVGVVLLVLFIVFFLLLVVWVVGKGWLVLEE